MAFEWDEAKNDNNITKHGISFYEAQYAFSDKKRVVLIDPKHSSEEKRYFCIGKLTDGKVVTVRYTKRKGNVRIIGAGYWRKGKKIYEQTN